MEFPEFFFATSRGLPAKQNSEKQFQLMTFFLTTLLLGMARETKNAQPLFEFILFKWC